MTYETEIGTCHKCDGTGEIKEFGHIDAGVCYKCDGTGKVEKLVAGAEGDYRRKNVEWFIEIIRRGGRVATVTHNHTGEATVNAMRWEGGHQETADISPRQYAYLLKWDYRIGPSFPW